MSAVVLVFVRERLTFRYRKSGRRFEYREHVLIFSIGVLKS